MEYSDEDAPFEWEDPDHVEDGVGNAVPGGGPFDATLSVNVPEFVNSSGNDPHVGTTSSIPSGTEQSGFAIQSPVAPNDDDRGTGSGLMRLLYNRNMNHSARIRHETNHRAIYDSVPPRTDFPKGSTFACRACTYESQTYQGLERHLQSMLDLGDHVCPYCLRRYARPYLGRRHSSVCLSRMKRKDAGGGCSGNGPPGGNGRPPPGNGGSGSGGAMGGPHSGTSQGLLA